MPAACVDRHRTGRPDDCRHQRGNAVPRQRRRVYLHASRDSGRRRSRHQPERDLGHRRRLRIGGNRIRRVVETDTADNAASATVTVSAAAGQPTAAVAVPLPWARPRLTRCCHCWRQPAWPVWARGACAGTEPRQRIHGALGPGLSQAPCNRRRFFCGREKRLCERAYFSMA